MGGLVVLEAYSQQVEVVFTHRLATAFPGPLHGHDETRHEGKQDAENRDVEKHLAQRELPGFGFCRLNGRGVSSRIPPVDTAT